jgi:bifunctional non-homologous end joining protein LigD
VAARHERLSFVIQKHAASRLHYDFRLELDGTLVSWAVPKGPSLDPRVRRIAVHVEDHPLSYASFEGVIPKGHYGAGTVEVWDRGTWVPLADPREGLRRGKLKFELQGEKLHGRWNLVRINSSKDERQEPWLLIKEHDEYERPAAEYDITAEMPDSVLTPPAKVTKAAARKATAKKAAPKKPDARKTATKAKASKKARGAASDAGDAAAAIPRQAERAKLPLSLFPQLATLVDEVPADESGWIYEIKFDGYRTLVRIEGDDVRLFTRNGNNWTGKLKALHDDFAALKIASAWIDGEIVVMNAKGLPDFQALQNAFDSARTKDIVYFAFDLPYFGGYDLRRVPLVERRKLLQALLAEVDSPRIRFSESFDGPAAPLLENACKQGLEGLIGKRAASPYTTSRSTAWIKLKCTRRQEFVVVGYTDPKGSRVGFGSLLLAVNDKAGKLQYAGNVGTGFDTRRLEELYRQLKALEQPRSPLAAVPRGVKGHWVKPRLIAEVAFTEWTGDGRIRHPVFHGLRTDKDVEAIVREEPRPMEGGEPVEEKPRAGSRVAEARARGDVAEAASVEVTHPDRVIDAASKAKKIDLVRYYEAVAPHILPHLEGRPIALVRAPLGIGKQLFFQKHVEKVKIPGIRQLPRSYWPGHPAMIEIASAATLVAAAQVNVVELHTWNSTTEDIAHPDRVIFDLDPGEGISWETLKEATTLTKKMLDLLGLRSFLKTSGGKGLHVVVPLTPQAEWDYDAVRDFSEKMTQHMARTLPNLFVAKSGPQNRIGRIFLDYLRNGTGATTVAAFSARARPGLGVSVPVRWNELAKLERADQWNIFTVHERLAKLRADPWKDYWTTEQTLDDASARLAEAMRD